MVDNDEEVIDLTRSYILANHSSLDNSVILIDSEDSPDRNNVDNKKRTPDRKIRKRKNEPLKTLTEEIPPSLQRSTNFLGICPICREDLEKRKLASTTCGHIFCYECIKESVRRLKQCSTCRAPLKGPSSYHPLYLGI